jgi:heme-degrading monooxygenase HmoA
MHLRLSRFAGLDPDRIDETLQRFQEDELPRLEQQEGFGGITVGINRGTGQAVAVVLWESETAMRTSEKLADEVRDRAVATAKPSREPVVDHYEVVLRK